MVVVFPVYRHCPAFSLSTISVGILLQDFCVACHISPVLLGIYTHGMKFIMNAVSQISMESTISLRCTWWRFQFNCQHINHNNYELIVFSEQKILSGEGHHKLKAQYLSHMLSIPQAGEGYITITTFLRQISQAPAIRFQMHKNDWNAFKLFRKLNPLVFLMNEWFVLLADLSDLSFSYFVIIFYMIGPITLFQLIPMIQPSFWIREHSIYTVQGELQPFIYRSKFCARISFM